MNTADGSVFSQSTAEGESTLSDFLNNDCILPENPNLESFPEIEPSDPLGSFPEVDKNNPSQDVLQLEDIKASNNLHESATTHADEEVAEKQVKAEEICGRASETVNEDYSGSVAASIKEDTESLVGRGKSQIGKSIRKKFGRKYFYGSITEYDEAEKLYKIKYEDDDEEELEWDELEPLFYSNIGGKNAVNKDDQTRSNGALKDGREEAQGEEVQETAEVGSADNRPQRERKKVLRFDEDPVQELGKIKRSRKLKSGKTKALLKRVGGEIKKKVFGRSEAGAKETGTGDEGDPETKVVKVELDEVAAKNDNKDVAKSKEAVVNLRKKAANVGFDAVGQKVKKKFGTKYFSGVVKQYFPRKGYYKVVYEDGDREEMWWEELQKILVKKHVLKTSKPQSFRKGGKVLSTLFKRRIPSKFNKGRKPRKVETSSSSTSSSKEKDSDEKREEEDVKEEEAVTEAGREIEEGEKMESDVVGEAEGEKKKTTKTSLLRSLRKSVFKGGKKRKAGENGEAEEGEEGAAKKMPRRRRKVSTAFPSPTLTPSYFFSWFHGMPTEFFSWGEVSSSSAFPPELVSSSSASGVQKLLALKSLPTESSISQIAASQHHLAVATSAGHVLMWRNPHGYVRQRTGQWEQVAVPQVLESGGTGGGLLLDVCGPHVDRSAGGYEPAQEDQIPDPFYLAVVASDGQDYIFTCSPPQDEVRTLGLDEEPRFPGLLASLAPPPDVSEPVAPPIGSVVHVSVGVVDAVDESPFVGYVTNTGRVFVRAATKDGAQEEFHGIEGFEGLPVKIKCGGAYQAVILTDNGKVWTWNWNSPQTEAMAVNPNPNITPAVCQAAAGSLLGRKAIDVDCFGNDFVALTDDGEVHFWTSGVPIPAMGIFHTPCPPLPPHTPAIPPSDKLLRLSLGAGVCAGVTAKGRMHTWRTGVSQGVNPMVDETPLGRLDDAGTLVSDLGNKVVLGVLAVPGSLIAAVGKLPPKIVQKDVDVVLE